MFFAVVVYVHGSLKRTVNEDDDDNDNDNNNNNNNNNNKIN